jgi:hypothetical protein
MTLTPAAKPGGTPMTTSQNTTSSAAAPVDGAL